jgi:phenylacetate-CoA ligase
LSFNKLIYDKLPVALQNVVCSVYGYKEYRKRYGKYFFDKLTNLEETQWFSKGQIEIYQSEQLQNIIRHAYEHIPYYNDLFKKNKIHPDDIRTLADLGKIPVLTKEDVRKNWQRMIAPGYQKSAFLSHTSGSTGKALDFYLTSESVQFQWAVWWRFRKRFGIEMGQKSINFIGKLAVPLAQRRLPFWRYNRASNQYIVNMQHIKEDNVKYFVDFINKEKAQFFSGYPSIIYALAVLIKNSEFNIEHGPQWINTGAEALYKNQQELMEEVFGCPVIDQYGFSEGAANASKCKEGLYHEDFEFGILEKGPAVGEDAHSVLATGFANYAMPFIRYEVGDSAVWTSVKCDCGRESRTIERIEGRTEDFILTPEGTRILRFDYLFKSMSNVKECQVVQRKLGQVVFKVVPRPGFNTTDEKTLEKLVREWISKEIKVEVERVDEIPRTASGKFKAVVSEIN